MFLICRGKDKCGWSLSKLISRLESINCGPIHFIDIGQHWFGWFRSKTFENLHVYNNGILVGKLSFTEKSVDTIIYHDGDLPNEIHPLLTGVSIRTKGSSTSINPFNITNIFYGGESVSDMQLLIADAEGFLPSAEGVGVLATVGYFPGNLTLFREIKKMPFLTSYELSTHQLTHIPAISYQKPDDIEMIERLIEIVPIHPRQYLGISGGYDSRFVLGILMQKGILPSLIHINSGEIEKVLKIAEFVNLPCINVKNSDLFYLSPDLYTLATDAQIYFRGGNYSCVRNMIESDSLFHFGHFSIPMIKNAYKGVIKAPDTCTGNIYSRFINRLFKSQGDGMTSGLCDIRSLQYLKDHMLDELKFGQEYCSFRTKKEWANWYYYLHKAMRWTPAHMADLSYFTHPINLLSDLQALMLGISSDAWSNFNNDRVRKLNTALLPNLSTPYNDGEIYPIENRIINSWRKLNKEYLYKILNPRATIIDFLNRKKISAPNKNMIFSFNYVDFHANDFSHYFTDTFENIVRKPEYSNWLKRAAVTVGYTLQFLGH